MLKRIMAVLLLAASSSVQSTGLDLALSDQTASFMLLTDSSSLGYGGADVGYGVFFNEENDFILNARFLVTGNPASSGLPLQFGVGAKAYLGSFDRADLDLGAIGIGGLVRYVIPSSIAPMAATVEAYHAPNITSFVDAESLTEISFRYEFEIVPSTSAYLGYRLIEVDFETLDDAEFDDEFHIGIRLTF